MTTPYQAGFQVIGITAGQFQTSPNGDPVRGRIVTYELHDGTRDEVFVPDRDWGTGRDQATVSAAAATTWQIRQHSGEL